ncbi:VWD domain-containing protein [Catellatospora sp. KI3]|uniref:VWD domain-containing protein n=1 Tax=Catellatospora sp. KI3 TaxID=3041620 RepID=UPI002482A89A|nr:VWD domain-containing protein [Catellatospora sp. KI3]MDI1460810.1 VWD domain-containing protein [Catellatospora sp. KI3]
MRAIVRWATGAAVLALAAGVWPAASAAAADGGIGLAVHTAAASYAQGEPILLSLTVTNASGSACGLAAEPDGTVQITSVRRDGQELSPALGRVFYPDGLGSAVIRGTRLVEPGASAQVSLVSLRVHEGTAGGGVVLPAVAATAGGGGVSALWPVGAPGRYEVTMGYAVPVLGGAVEPCAGAAEAAAVAFTVGEPVGTFPWLWVLAAVAALAVAGVLVFVLVRRRRAPAALLLLVALVATVGLDDRAAQAAMTPTGSRPLVRYTVDPSRGVPIKKVDFPAKVAECMAEFEKPGGDPSGLLPRLKDPDTPLVRIYPVTGESKTFETPASPEGAGTSTIIWDPLSTEPYGDGVERDPCAALYHELNHADDVSRDRVPQGDCGDTGLSKAEASATLRENVYRKNKNLTQRSEYLGKKLPKSMADCDKKPPKKTPPPKGPKTMCEGLSSSGCGSTNGDPHLVTFDHAYYDLQAVGEFTLVRSVSGDRLEVQARQSPLGDWRTASVNTAVAFGLGDHRVALTLTGGRTRVHVDGELVDVARGERALPGGGTLTRRESDTGPADGYDLSWPDSSRAAVDQIGSYGYRLIVKLAPSRAGKVRGLLGDFDGDPADDIAPPTGAALTQPVPFEQLYPAYADSWRITQDGSLFTYDTGQSTQTFTDRTFPDRPVDLSAERRAQAEAVCRWAGIVSAQQFAECVFDVAVTGRPEFAVSGATTELVAPPPPPPIAAKPVASGTVAAGGAGLTFTGRAGDAVYVDIAAPALPDWCAPYRLLDPTGSEISSGCNIGGAGRIERTALTKDGTYTLKVEGRADVTGTATMRVYAAADVTGTITPNGDPVSVTIDVPGSIARYTFAGRAGQRVYLDVPSSDLADQCAPLELVGPSGATLNSGCVISGSGYVDGFVLPADGTYTIRVDPIERTLGSARLRLYAAADEVATLTPGGPPTTATVRQPGAVLVFRFSGTAGTSVRLTVTDSTLADQCSPLELRAPGGDLVATGCVIGGQGGIEPEPLPSTGTYTIVVDAVRGTSGVLTLSLS